VCTCVYNTFLLLLCKEKKNGNGSVDGLVYDLECWALTVKNVSQFH
jgi:hypothetical protein